MPRPPLLRPLLERMRKGDIDPSFIVTHRMSLDDAPSGCETVKNEQDERMEVVLRPWPPPPRTACGRARSGPKRTAVRFGC